MLDHFRGYRGSIREKCPLVPPPGSANALSGVKAELYDPSVETVRSLCPVNGADKEGRWELHMCVTDSINRLIGLGLGEARIDGYSFSGSKAERKMHE